MSMTQHIRFGPRRVPGQHANTPGYHGILPGNAGISKAAQDRIDLITSAQSRKAKEAISGIDAVQLYVWQPLTGGLACGCKTTPDLGVIAQPSGNSHVLGTIEDQTDDADDFKSPLRVKSRDVTAYDINIRQTPPTRPDNNFNEADIFDDEAIPPVSSTGGTDNPYVDGSKSTGPYEGETAGGGNLFLHQGAYDHEMPDSKEEEFGEELISDYETDAWNPDSLFADNAFVVGSSLATCPICFGTGLLGGYSLFGATRIVLSSVNATGGFNLGPSTDEPPIFSLNCGEDVQWIISNCPNYFTLGWAVIRNLRKDVTNSLYASYSIDGGSTWDTLSNLQSVNNVNLSNLIIRVQNNNDDNSAPIAFSHLDISLFHNVVLGQVTNFNQQSGIASVVKGGGLTITVPPDVGLVDRNALIGEAKHKLMWRVTDTDVIATHTQQIISCTLYPEILEPSLIETTLFPLYDVNGQALKIYGAGVEPIQGER